MRSFDKLQEIVKYFFYRSVILGIVYAVYEIIFKDRWHKKE
jgi:hypothetical protein